MDAACEAEAAGEAGVVEGAGACGVPADEAEAGAVLGADVAAGAAVAAGAGLAGVAGAERGGAGAGSRENSRVNQLPSADAGLAAARRATALAARA